MSGRTPEVVTSQSFEPLSDDEKDGIYLAAGPTVPGLAESIAQHMGTELHPPDGCRQVFSNGEFYYHYDESVAGKEVYILQTNTGLPEDNYSINDSIQESILMIDAAVRARATNVTLIAPYFGYSRQDRKAEGRSPISSSAHIKQLAAVGLSHLVAVDLHSPQIQGYFEHFDNLPTIGRFTRALEQFIEQEGHERDDLVIVAPDAGAAKLAENLASRLSTDNVAVMPKIRRGEQISRLEATLDVDGKVCILPDDMIDTAGTIASSANKLKDSGAEQVVAVASHGIFSGNAIDHLANSGLDRIFVTNSLPQHRIKEALGNQLEVVSIASLLGQAIVQLARNESISIIFNDENGGQFYR